MQSLPQISCFSSHTLFQTWAPSMSSLGGKCRNMHLPEGTTCINLLIFLGNLGLVIPRMSPWHSCSEKATKSMGPHTFLLEYKFPWKEKFMDEWFPIQATSLDQQGSFSKIHILGSSDLFPKLPMWFWCTVKFSIYLSTCSSALGCGYPSVCLKNPSHELHQNQLQWF